MTDLEELRRVALAGVVLAIVLGGVSIVLGLAAVDWNLDGLTFGRPEVVLQAGSDGALLWRWSMLLDVFYSYLLLAPLALYGHRRLRDRRPWLADIGLLGAALYIGFGAAGAAILAVAGSALIEAYSAAASAERIALETSFRLLRDALYFGVWQLLDMITAGTWVFTSGMLLLGERALIARLLIGLAVGLWLGALATALGVHSLPVLAAILAVAVMASVGWFVRARARRGE